MTMIPRRKYPMSVIITDSLRKSIGEFVSDCYSEKFIPIHVHLTPSEDALLNIELTKIARKSFGGRLEKVRTAYAQTLREHTILIRAELRKASQQSTGWEAYNYLADLNLRLRGHLQQLPVHLMNPRKVPGQLGRMRLASYADPINIDWPKDE
jgi:hypothetical protein